MKRHISTKLSAAASAFLVLSLTACAMLPVCADARIPLTVCTAEAEGNMLPFDITPSAAGSGRTSVAPETPAEPGNAAGTEENLPSDSSFGTANDAVGGNDPAGDMTETPVPENTSPTTGVTEDSNAGNGNRQEGQAGGDENGRTGEKADPSTPDTAENPVKDAVDEVKNDVTEAANGKTNWASIVIALVIAVTLVAVVVALIPRKRTD